MGITGEADPGPSEMAKASQKTPKGDCKCVYKRDKICLLSVLDLSGTELYEVNFLHRSLYDAVLCVCG